MALGMGVPQDGSWMYLIRQPTHGTEEAFWSQEIDFHWGVQGEQGSTAAENA